MGPLLEVTVTGLRELEANLRALGAGASRALARAANRAAQSGRTLVVRALATDTGLPQHAIRPSIELARATPGNPNATLRLTGRRIPLIAFQARQTRAGVTYRTGAGRGLVPSAFLATMRSGHQGVFKRVTTRRLPIRELFGPSLPHVLRQPRIFEPLRAPMVEAFQRHLAHEVEFLLRSSGRAASPEPAAETA